MEDKMDSIKTTDINETQGLPIVEPTSFLGYKFNVDVSTQQALELAKLDYEIGFEQSEKYLVLLIYSLKITAIKNISIVPEIHIRLCKIGT